MESWIKRLAYQEDQMEHSGQIPLPKDFTPSKEELEEHTIEFLKQLRLAFTQSISLFNQLKGYTSSIRIYGITDTKGDFMLFRNGFKLVFSMKQAGLIVIRLSQAASTLDQTQAVQPANYIKGVWKPFGELQWTNNDQPIRIDYLVRYYTTVFVQQSMR